MKKGNANKVIPILMSVAMCPMMLPTTALAADDGAAPGVSSTIEQAQPADQTEASSAGASSGTTSAMQSKAAGGAAGTTAASNEAAAPVAETGGEDTTASVAEVNGVKYSSLQEAINAAGRKATVKLLADTKENVTISTPYLTLDLNGCTLNGSTGERKPALTVTSRAYVVDSSEAQTGTIMREDTAENSGVSSHYVIDVQDKGWLFFQGGNVKNDSGAGGTKGASLVRVGDDSKSAMPGLTISGGTFTQDNFIVLKCDHGDLFVKGGTINSAKSYAVQNWKRTTIKDSAVINGNVSTWTYGGSGSDLTIAGGTVNGDVESVTYDGAAGKPAKVAITGGTVGGALKTVDYSTGTTTDDPTKATIEVTGGTFSSDPSRYLVESSSATQNEDGTYGVEKAYLAQVGDTSYYTMEDAFKAQTENGGVITLLRDYTTGSTFNSGSIAREIDLNGHTWTCTGNDSNSAAFEINYPNASLTVKNGKIMSSQLIGLIPSANGGTITYDNSSLTFENVEATTTASSGIETNGNNTNDAVTLKDSTLNVPNGFGIYFPSSGTLTIDNSTINAKTMGVQVCSGNLNINEGSTITVSGDPLAKTEGDGAIQDGAAISIVNRPGYKGLDQIAITGGNFTAKGDNAAMKAYSWNSSTKQESPFGDADNVTVSGGDFNGSFDADGIEVSGGEFTDGKVAQHLKKGSAALFGNGKYVVAGEEAVKGDATYSVTNTDGTVVYFTDAQSANDYAQESGAQAPKVLKVTVNFDSKQGTAVDPQLVAVGSKVVKPADPTKEGYTFFGWFTDEDCTNAYDFDADVDGTQPEFTLYAGWKAAPATVEPGAGDNGNSGSNGNSANNGSNGDNSSTNENVVVDTVNNNGDNASSEAKMATVKTGDNLALISGAIAVIAVAAAGVAAFALRRKKMN